MLYLFELQESRFSVKLWLDETHFHRKNHWSLKEASGSLQEVFIKGYLELTKVDKAK